MSQILRFIIGGRINLTIYCLPVKSASFILLQGVPSGISLQEVDQAIRDVDGVQDVHELHIWQLSESRLVASVHVLASRKHDFMQVAADIRKALHDRGIHSSTIQPEYHRQYPSEGSAVVSMIVNLQKRLIHEALCRHHQVDIV